MNEQPGTRLQRFADRLGMLSVIPLTIALLWYGSVEIERPVIDGPPEQYYGAPLPWVQDSIFSLEGYVYLVPLAIDIAFWGAVSCGMIAIWRRRTFLRRRWTSAVLASLAWGLGLYVAPIFVFCFGFLARYYVWYSSSAEATSLAITRLAPAWPP